ncbi:hypothetical protein PLEOSDRAFT_1113601 [Pleurotus ostreatus PC15]|uniref:Uncharacterized protein n=1 Tax=Pleurotus ostreatus (strain PC15) TaxID=1137138 RepID=A0A067NCY4_PLEO1|nr:hypothetical protein PLEOSDRAFT_1113601 [Pleurotus ostreatus PC15]
MQATLRLSRQNLVSGARASLRSQTSVATRRFAGRRWNSSHGPGHEQKKSSDMPWVIGSLVTFGPAFLYLVSPSARKTAPGHAAHAHDSHAEPKKVTMKDDEGQEADVTASVQAATADDAPKADGAKVDASEVEQPQADEATEKSEEPAAPPPSDGEEPTQKPGSLQDGDSSGPVDLGDARAAAKSADVDAPKKAETSDA